MGARQEQGKKGTNSMNPANLEAQLPKETNTPAFEPISTSKNIAAWCVDGREGDSKEKGRQMLGGSLHPLVLSSVYHQLKLDSDFTKNSLAKLKDNGYATGVHRGSHKNSERKICDCGFCDKLKTILEKINSNREVIKSRIVAVYMANKDKIDAAVSQFFSPEEIVFLLDQAFEKFEQYDIKEKIEKTGEDLLSEVESLDTNVVNVLGDHAEAVAYVNLKPNTTLDTNKLNRNSQQAFNLDLWAVIEEAKILGVDPKFSILASLILYVATEMVLVEDKGKPALKVLIYA